MTIRGGCHCGHIKYECIVKPDPESGDLKVFRCNCTYCQKLSTTNLHLDGPEDFKLLSPASKEEVADYPSKMKSVNRYFCATCGVHVWMQGSFEFQGKTAHLFVVNLSTAEQPQEGLELTGSKDEPWPGGLV
ncbi:hypothetical protein GJ744_011875 [Endocarpon pusillum]|uniref:CENP-V/GFA domain-containing protein n=1 Tax=Endocarpon pusillum TaxID=364733 RepID=A0A8H7AFW5_9EURO|nr:hypothetical protein GJ744_011875 [Endocarpon pusillum]